MSIHRFFTSAASLILATAFLSSAETETAVKDRRAILVAPFENISQVKAMVSYDALRDTGEHTPVSAVVADARNGVAIAVTGTQAVRKTLMVDRYSEAPRGMLEDLLAQQPGLVVVERQRVDALLQEQQFSGFTNQGDAIALSKVAGARYLATGTVQDIATRETNFTGYGISSKRIQVTAQVRVRLVDIETGQIVASTSAQGQETYATDRFGGLTDSDVAYRVISNAVIKIGENKAFFEQVRAQAGTPSVNIAVQVEPTPPGADVLVNDTFVGNAPISITLPSGRPSTISIQAGGYTAWQRSVVPQAGMRIAPTLIQASKP